MQLSIQSARKLAAILLGNLRPRWSHVRAAGQTAEHLCEACGLPEDVAVAAWLHDIGYSAAIKVSGFHPLDGARFLAKIGAQESVVGLVAWHTGAKFEANERGLLPDLSVFAKPGVRLLDQLTMIDLATGPTGLPVRDVDRITEILERYDAGHPVYLSIQKSREYLLDSSRNGKASLGLPNDWPC